MNNLSDQELLNRLEQLVRKEQHLTLDILPHLLEVDRRKLYLELGCPSVYKYCREHLNYSESSTNRRLAAARCRALLWAISQGVYAARQATDQPGHRRHGLRDSHRRECR